MPLKMSACPPNRKLYIILTSVLAVAVAVTLIWLNRPGTDAPEPAGGVPVEGMSRGETGAPVTIEVYSDFQCPWCRRAAQEVQPILDERYIATGKARMVYRHFPFLGMESVWAAEAATCASNQGAFWSYHDLLFANQQGENRGVFQQERLKEFAGRLGLERNEFDRCLDSRETLELVRRDFELGKAAGVQGTPTFFINGKVQQNWQPDTLARVIESELKSGGR
ncbi:MAG: DsbA family protein [Firmicutes bacterium]|nr:DsbA family protein [Bacillota bacterium]